LGIVEKGFAPAYHHQTAVDEGGNIYTLTPKVESPNTLTIHDQTGSPEKEFDLATNEFPEFDRRYKGGGMIIQDQLLYYMYSSGKDIQLFDLRQEENLAKIPFRPEYKPPINKDFPPDPYEAIRKLRSIMEEHYIISEVYKISDSTALIQTQFQIDGEGKFGLHKMNLITKEVSLMTTLDSPFIFAADNKGYRIEDDRMEDENTLNPKIVVYSFEE
jgi:hypothetical protein